MFITGMEQKYESLFQADQWLEEKHTFSSKNILRVKSIKVNSSEGPKTYLVNGIIDFILQDRLRRWNRGADGTFCFSVTFENKWEKFEKRQQYQH